METYKKSALLKPRKLLSVNGEAKSLIFRCSIPLPIWELLLKTFLIPVKGSEKEPKLIHPRSRRKIIVKLHGLGKVDLALKEQRFILPKLDASKQNGRVHCHPIRLQ